MNRRDVNLLIATVAIGVITDAEAATAQSAAPFPDGPISNAGSPQDDPT